MLSESSCISWELSLVQSLNRQNLSVTYSPHCRTWGLLKPYTKNSHVEHPVPLVVPLQSTGARHCPQLSFCRKNSTHGRSGTFSFCYCFLYCKDNVLDTSHFKTAQETFIDMPFHSSSSNQSPEASLKVIALSFLEYKSWCIFISVSGLEWTTAPRSIPKTPLWGIAITQINVPLLRSTDKYHLWDSDEEDQSMKQLEEPSSEMSNGYISPWPQNLLCQKERHGMKRSFSKGIVVSGHVFVAGSAKQFQSWSQIGTSGTIGWG